MPASATLLWVHTCLPSFLLSTSSSCVHTNHHTCIYSPTHFLINMFFSTYLWTLTHTHTPHTLGCSKRWIMEGSLRSLGPGCSEEEQGTGTRQVHTRCSFCSSSTTSTTKRSSDSTSSTTSTIICLHHHIPPRVVWLIVLNSASLSTCSITIHLPLAIIHVRYSSSVILDSQFNQLCSVLSSSPSIFVSLDTCYVSVCVHVNFFTHFCKLWIFGVKMSFCNA